MFSFFGGGKDFAITVDTITLCLCKHGGVTIVVLQRIVVGCCHIRKWIMLTCGWKQWWIGQLCNAMKNHALQQRRGAEAVPLSPSWQVCSVTWQLSISMINAVVLGLPFAKLKSVLRLFFKVKWMSDTTQLAKEREPVFFFSSLGSRLHYEYYF